ncbi:hypothetical protein MNEG_5525 [Monoraphidium neglectum]|uniref:Uncharacterized protein n=1 Tax=Monoraphidium neglectum TaxID=145388 RepID=A0A0D2JU45_9CHLO|nr:hypothetical protein MNEG_5525 [Monoraphidium neglectum]KIZ02433.1 hypothetical protein MNEG_5525 [Monoraphidium neglectum]|eukprot:XP_013901452.1 hypothetical protein MNEG_5525 [Monoraphidium neglectum]
MDAPPPRQQLLLALPELFPGDDNIEFCGEAAVAIGQKPADWAAGLLGLPIGYRRAAIKAAVRDTGAPRGPSQSPSLPRPFGSGRVPEKKTIRIVQDCLPSFDESLPYTATFADEADFKEYLSRTGEGGLIFFDQQQLQASDSGGLCGKLVMSFCKLEEGGLYVLGFVSEQVLKCLREEGARIKRQEEFGCALEAVLAEEDPEQGYKLRRDLRALPGPAGSMRDFDAVVLGRTKAYVGSHTMYAADAE